MSRTLASLLFLCAAMRCGGELEPDPTIGTDGTMYNSVTSTSAWSATELEQLLGDPTAGLSAFNGGTFDGRYVYLASQIGGLAYRFDTSMPLSSAKAWSTFDTKIAESPLSIGFGGTAFDGRYVYWSSCTTFVFRYDTQAPFGAATAWTSFDRGVLGGKSFESVVSDGRYLFFMPSGIDGHLVVRYDTQAPFDDATSWATFDVTTAFASAGDFGQGAFDGRYVYALGDDPNGQAFFARYDTQAPFATASSWTFFDPSVVESTGHLKRGFVFDGRFLYVGNGPDGVTLRYDTHAPFTEGSSWVVISLKSLVPSTWEHVDIVAADFDGRFVYFDADATHDTAATYQSSFIIQCDTQAPFDSAASCTSFAATSSLMSAVNGGYAESFYTTVFDGRFMYFASDDFTMVARFDVKSPSSMPALPAFHGSFF